MERLSLDLVRLILEALDPESRFHLATTCKAYWETCNSRQFAGYQSMAPGTPWVCQRLEAVAHEGTLAQREHLSTCQLSWTWQQTACEHHMMAFLMAQYPKSKGAVMLAAALGRVDIIGGLEAIECIDICLTGLLHGHPEILKYFIGESSDEMSAVACMYILDANFDANTGLNPGLPSDFASLIRLSHQRRSASEKEILASQSWYCPTCSSAESPMPLLDVTDQHAQTFEFLPLSGPLVEVWPISCVNNCVFCVKCLTYQIHCPGCNGFGKFISAELIGELDADPEMHSLCERYHYVELLALALACPLGLPLAAGGLVGPDGGWPIWWECSSCGAHLKSIDK